MVDALPVNISLLLNVIVLRSIVEEGVVVQGISSEFLTAANVLVAVAEDERACLVVIEHTLVLAGNLSKVLLPLSLEELEDLHTAVRLLLDGLGRSNTLMEVCVSYNSGDCYRVLVFYHNLIILLKLELKFKLSQSVVNYRGPFLLHQLSTLAPHHLNVHRFDQMRVTVEQVPERQKIGHSLSQFSHRHIRSAGWRSGSVLGS